MINGQTTSFLIFICTGIVISLLFDFFRILRRSFKTPDFVTYIEDIIFWIITGLILIYSIFEFNNGEIRIYIFLGILLGVTIYMLTISKYIIKANVFLIVKLKRSF